jgi:hypothetical protein
MERIENKFDQLENLSAFERYELESYWEMWLKEAIDLEIIAKTKRQDVTCDGVKEVERETGAFWKAVRDPWELLPGFWIWEGRWARVKYNAEGKTIYGRRSPPPKCPVFGGSEKQLKYNKKVYMYEEAVKRGWLPKSI